MASKPSKGPCEPTDGLRSCLDTCLGSPSELATVEPIVEPAPSRSVTLSKSDFNCTEFGTIKRGQKDRLVCVIGESRSTGKTRVKVWNKSKKKWQAPQAVESHAIRKGADPKKFGMREE